MRCSASSGASMDSSKRQQERGHVSGRRAHGATSLKFRRNLVSWQRAISPCVRFIGKPGRTLSGSPAAAGALRDRSAISISRHRARRHSEFPHKRMSPQDAAHEECSQKQGVRRIRGRSAILGTDHARLGAINNDRGNANGRTTWNACRILTPSRRANGSTRCAQFSTIKARTRATLPAREAGRGGRARRHRPALDAEYALREYDPAGARGTRRLGSRHRASHSLDHPLERGRHHPAGQQGIVRAGRPHCELPVGRDPLRHRLRAFLARAVGHSRGRSHLHAGALGPGHLCACLRGGTAQRAGVAGVSARRPAGRASRPIRIPG